MRRYFVSQIFFSDIQSVTLNYHTPRHNDPSLCPDTRILCLYQRQMLVMHDWNTINIKIVRLAMRGREFLGPPQPNSPLTDYWGDKKFLCSLKIMWLCDDKMLWWCHQILSSQVQWAVQDVFMVRKGRNKWNRWPMILIFHCYARYCSSWYGSRIRFQSFCTCLIISYFHRILCQGNLRTWE